MATESSPAQRPQRGLLRVLGLAFGIAVVVGGMVGGGILRTPGAVAAQLPDARLIYLAWILGGAYVLLAVNTYAELATALPTAGGGYVYLRHTYGNFIGFAAGWNDFIINTNGIAYLAIVTAEYLAALRPALGGHENLVGPALIVAFGVIHSLGIRTSSAVQQLTSFLKIALLLALVVAVFLLPAVAVAPGATAIAMPHHGSLLLAFGAIVVATQLVMETYAGFNSNIYFAEETNDPGRTIPRSMFGGAIIVIALYLLVNAALLHGLTIRQIATSKLPVADLAAAYFGSGARTAVTVIAVVSVLGIVNTLVLYTPRTLYAMSRDRMLPRNGSFVSSGGVPLVAMWASIAVATLFASLGTFDTLIAIGAFLGLAGDTLIYAAIFVLRRREPELHRPFRAIGYPLIPLLIPMIAVALLAAYLLGNPRPSTIGVVLILAAYPAFRLLTHRLRDPEIQ